MNFNRLRLMAVAGVALAVMAACVPVRDARYRDPNYDPYRGSGYRSDVHADGSYRASDGRVFRSRGHRDAYQQQLNDRRAYDRVRAARDQRRGDGDHRYRRRGDDDGRVRRRGDDDDRRVRRRGDDDDRRVRRRGDDDDRAGRRAGDDDRARRRARDDDRDRRRARDRDRRRDGRAGGRYNRYEDRPLPEGWSVIQKDGRTMYMDTEGRIRSDY